MCGVVFLEQRQELLSGSPSSPPVQGLSFALSPQVGGEVEQLVHFIFG